MFSPKFRGVPEVHQNTAQMLYHAATYADVSRRNAPITRELLGLNQGMAMAMAKDPEFSDAFEPQDSDQFMNETLEYEYHGVDRLGSSVLQEMIQGAFGNDSIAEGTAKLMERAIVPFLARYSKRVDGLSELKIKNFFSPIFNYVESLEKTKSNN